MIRSSRLRIFGGLAALSLTLAVPMAPARAGIIVLNVVNSNGYQFVNFDGLNPGTNAGAGTNANGISNAGTSVGFVIDNNGNFTNFTVNPLRPNTFQELNINGSTTAQAFGVNRAGVVVGTDGNGNAFYLSHGRVTTFIGQRIGSVHSTASRVGWPLP